MWVLDQKHSGIVLVRQRPARAVTLAGFLGAIVSLVPLVVAPDPGPLRFFSFAVLALTSGALVFLGWSRPKRIELVQKTGGLTWGDEPLPPPSYVLLSGDSTEDRKSTRLNSSHSQISYAVFCLKKKKKKKKK